jgi:hypothetical protein
MLILRLSKKTVFLLEPDQLKVLQEWLGPPTTKDLKIALKQRLKFAIPIGLLFLFFSIPLAGDPDAGLEPVPFDPVSAILGALFITLGLIMKFWPRRELFLLDAGWLVLLAAKITYDIFYGSHWLWSLLILVLLFSAREAMRLFKRFETIPPEVSPPHHANLHPEYNPPSHNDTTSSHGS